MAETPQTSQSPTPVTIVPAVNPEQAAIERFSGKLDRMGTAPTMTMGDTNRRPQPQQTPPAEAQSEPAAETPPAETGAVPAEEEYEFDFNGSRYRVPKELKVLHEERMRLEDYTRKTQEVAELRRSAEAALQQSRNHQEMQQALAPVVNRLNTVNATLDEYNKLDWNRLYQENPTLAQQHSVQFTVLNNQKQGLERQIQQTAQQHVQKLSETEKQALEASDKAMALKVKGWTRDTGKAVNEFARKSYGFTENEVNTTFDPRVLEMIYDAKQWRDLQASKSSKVVQPDRTLKPAAANPATSADEKRAEIRKGFRTAKTDGERDRVAERLMALKIR